MTQNHNNISTSVRQSQDPFDWADIMLTVQFCKDNLLRYIPVDYGTKKPSVEWKHLQEAAPTREELARIYSGQPTNIGCVCGGASGGLVVLAFNDQNGAKEFFKEHYEKLIEQTYVVQSKRGQHFYFKSATQIESDMWGTPENPSFLEIRSDGRMTVMPPSLHIDRDALYKRIGANKIARPSNLAEWLPQRIAELGLTNKHGERQREEKSGKKPHWLEGVWGGVKKGERDNTATRIAGYLRQKLPQNITLAILKDWGERCQPPCSDQSDLVDIVAKVNSIYRYPESQKVLDLVSLDILLNTEEDNPGELVSGILPEAGVCIIGGEPGSGKTWLVLVLARDLAAGKPFLNRFATQQGAVLIIDEESGRHRLHRRMAKLGAASGLPIEFSIMKAINLSDPSWEEPLRHAIEEKRPKMVVLDSLVRMHRGDENAAVEMAKLFATLNIMREELGCSFVITHHLRKRAQNRALNTLDQRLRGSSDIAAYADTVLGLDKIDERIVLSQLKNRDGDFFKPLALAIDDIEDDRTEVIVLAEIDEEADKRKLARELIRKALKEKPMLREELLNLVKTEGVSERTLTDSLKSLFDAGEIDKWKDGHKTVYGLKNG